MESINPKNVGSLNGILMTVTSKSNVMPKINGKCFRCECGCNVFHHPTEDDLLFECNSCEEWYRGERKDAKNAR